MLNSSAEQILARFIDWDNIMPKINEIKNEIENLLVNLRVEIGEFPFFLFFSEAQKPFKKLGVGKKISDSLYNILILAKVHHRVYPRVIREVTSKFGIRELQLSLTRDGEDFLTWNKNLQTPNGAFLTATFYPR